MFHLLTLLILFAGAQAKEFQLLQAGKAFLDPSLEGRAAALNQDPDGTRALALKFLKIHKGDSIVFKNRDIVAHNVASDDFDLRVQETGSNSAPQQFNKAGEHLVHCMIHPKMKIVIKVEDP